MRGGSSCLDLFFKVENGWIRGRQKMERGSEGMSRGDSGRMGHRGDIFCDPRLLSVPSPCWNKVW